MELVKVAKVGAKVEEVALDSGANVGDALRAAGVAPEGFELRLNGTPSPATAPVRGGDVITLVPQIKGGK
jgi:sulfur carrier protein ThiS